MVEDTVENLQADVAALTRSLRESIELILQLKDEVSDLRGFIDGMRAHVTAAGKMYGMRTAVTTNEGRP